MRTILPSALLLSLACSCAGPAPDPAPASEPAAAQAPQPAASPAPAPAAQPAASPARVAGAPLEFTTQPGWVVESPGSGMRKAQYKLPGEGAGDASLVVYYFGAQAGTLEANLERWASQFEQEDGSDSRAQLVKRERTVAGMAVIEVELSGTYVAETAPGSGVRVNEPGWRLLAAVIESDHGPYYLKLVGPAGTVERWEASFREFLAAVR